MDLMGRVLQGSDCEVTPEAVTSLWFDSSYVGALGISYIQER